MPGRLARGSPSKLVDELFMVECFRFQRLDLAECPISVLGHVQTYQKVPGPPPSFLASSFNRFQNCGGSETVNIT